jgi:hypothetical protein
MDKNISERTKRRRVQEKCKIYCSETFTNTSSEFNSKNANSGLLNKSTQDKIEEVSHISKNIDVSNFVQFCY